MSSSNGHLQIDRQDETKAYREVPPVDHPRFELNDLGNAKRLVRSHGNNILYVSDLSVWFYWDHKRWVEDELGLVEDYAKGIADVILEEANFVEGAEERAKYAEWARESQQKASIDAMIALAQGESEVFALAETLDRNPLLLNFPNGTLNIATGELHDHNRRDYITKLSRVAFDPEAQCPQWLKFLDRITGDNPDLIQALQYRVGGSLEASGPKEVILCHGPGAKTTFVEVIMTILGDYAQKAPRGLLSAKPCSATAGDQARLRGARVVVSNELSTDDPFDPELAYELIGGETLSSHSILKDFHVCRPRPTLWVLDNQLPRIEGTNESYSRRIDTIRFDIGIPSPELGTVIYEMLDELSGILNWALEVPMAMYGERTCSCMTENAHDN